MGIHVSRRHREVGLSSGDYMKYALGKTVFCALANAGSAGAVMGVLGLLFRRRLQRVVA